jgi:hypothetical protein
MANILLLASYFSPDQHVGANRWSKLVPHLVRLGHTFQVITQDNAREVPQTGTQLPVRIKVYRISYKDPIRTLLSMQHRKDVKLKPIKSGTTNNFGLQHYWEIVKSRLPYDAKSKISKGLSILRFPHPSCRWAKKTIPFALALAKQRKFDLIISTHPYMGCMIAAQKISEITRIPWIADMRDPWSEDHQSMFLNGCVFHRILQKMEKQCLSTASKVVTINPQLANLLLADTEKIEIIPNSFSPEEFISFNQKQPKGNFIHVVYTGTIQKSLTWKIFLDGIEKIKKDINNRIVFDYYGNSYKQLTMLARDAGLDSGIFLNHGSVDRESALRATCNADFLLVFGWQGKGADCVVTGKVLDYLGARKPIIAITKLGTALADLIYQTGAGIVLSDTEDVLSFFQQLIKKPKKIRRDLLAGRNEKEVKRYTTLCIARKYHSVIESIAEGA